MRILMTGSLFAFVLVSVGGGEETVREISWKDWHQSQGLLTGEIVAPDAEGYDEALRVQNTESTPKTVQVLVLDNPGVSSIRYAIAGQIRYEGVEGISYLEMWNHFSNGTAYFTRTLADTGPMGNIRGSSDWREFSLPFHSSREVGAPTKIVLNVVFAGRGTVEFSPIRVVQYAGPWWGWQIGVVIGAGGGSLLGLLGALIGTLAGLGKARRLVLGSTQTMFLLGLVGMVAGIAAVFQAQPFYVLLPLLVLGVICVAVAGPLIFVLRRRFEQLELRKMAAMDVAPPAAPDAGLATP
jgi:hypothetical protein